MTLEKVLRCIHRNEFELAKETFFQLHRDDRKVDYLITSFAFNFWYAFQAPAGKRNEYIGEAQSMYRKIKDFGIGITDEEKKVYDFFEGEPNMMGLLFVSYCMMNDVMRFEYFKDKFDFAYVTSSLVANQLLKILIMLKDYPSLKYILSNNKSLDFVYAINTLQAANNFSEKEKLEIMDIFASKAVFKNPRELKRQFNEALEKSTTNSERNVYFEMMARNGIEIDCSNLGSFNEVTSGMVYYLEKNISGRTLDEIDVETIISFAVKSKDSDVIVDILNALKTGAGVSEIGSYSISKLALTEFSSYDKLKILKQLMEFDLPERVIADLVKDYLEKNSDSPQDRLNYIKAIVDSCVNSNPKKSIFMKSYDNYIITNVKDGSYKVLIVDELMKALPTFDNVDVIVNKYMEFSRDQADIKQRLVTKFASYNANLPAEVCGKYLNMPVEEYDTAYKNVLKQYLKKQPSASMDQLSSYLKSPVPDEGNEVLSDILENISMVTQGELKNIITCSDEKKRNSALLGVLNKVSGLNKMKEIFIVSSSRLECNMLQGLLVHSKEDTKELALVVEKMKSMKCDADDKVEYMGKKLKWQELPIRAGLCQETKTICDKYC